MNERDIVLEALSLAWLYLCEARIAQMERSFRDRGVPRSGQRDLRRQWLKLKVPDK